MFVATMDNGANPMQVTAQRMTCTRCKTVFDAEVVTNAPIAVYVASLEAVRCPECGAHGKDLYLGGEKAGRESVINGTIEERARWWWSNGDRGVSSETIFSALASDVLRAELQCGRRQGTYDRPHDPEDYGRCRSLLDLIPEWRADLARVAVRFPWWAPLVEAWDEFDRLWDGDREDGCCPHLYARMQEVGNRVDALMVSRGE